MGGSGDEQAAWEKRQRLNSHLGQTSMVADRAVLRGHRMIGEADVTLTRVLAGYWGWVGTCDALSEPLV